MNNFYTFIVRSAINASIRENIIDNRYVTIWYVKK